MGIIFSQHAAAVGVCGFTGPSWLSQWRWQMVENQRNKVTELLFSASLLLLCIGHILLYFTLHCYVYITTDLLYCPVLLYITPYATIYYPISPHCSILPLSALYYPTLYTYIYHHTCLYISLNFSVSPPDLSKFPFSSSSTVYYPLCSILPHTALFHSFSSILPHTAL